MALRGALGYMFGLNAEAFWFWIEIALFVAPLVLLWQARHRMNPSRLFVAALSLLLGGFMLRINSFLIGRVADAGWHYSPR